jgi:subtilisin family serine protease
MKLLVILMTLVLISCTEPPQHVKKSSNLTRTIAVNSKPRCAKDFIVIAVIDTGFGFKDLGHDAGLCNFGHKDFSGDGDEIYDYDTGDAIPVDINGHGTNIVGIIDRYAKNADANYCIVVLKYYSENTFFKKNNLPPTVKAIRYATKIKADIINFSAEGPDPSREEEDAIKDFIDRGGTFVTAAGNGGLDLDNEKNHSYPAQDDPRVIAVGNLSKNGERHKTSNYGMDIKAWEIGEKISAYGLTLTGTSQAAAVYSGKLIGKKSICH